MANPLQISASAPPPNPEMTSQPQGAPQGNALASGGPMQPGPGTPMGGPQGAPQMPAPSYGQTMAAVRHFHAIAGQLSGLAQNPELGKSDMKSSIIDSTAKLVGERIMTPAQAVMVLTDVPERPYDQKIWVMNHLKGAQEGSNQVLDHFRAANMGADLSALPEHDDADHGAMMTGLQEHYKGFRNGQ